jgi:F0F1-type ATP synthase assembly protein I
MRKLFFRHPAKESTPMFNYKKNRAWAEGLHIVMQIGLTMAGCIVFCFFIGLYLDKWLGTKGIFVSIFIILGVIGGGVTVYRQIMDVTKEDLTDKK